MSTLKNRDIPEALLHTLREANQSLVIASLRAQDMQDEAEALVERQTEFLSMLAHELRNPLAPIATAAEMLEKIAAAHPQLPQLQQVIARQVSHMTRLLEDLQDASRVRSGKITLKKSPVLLADVVRSAVEISQPLLDRHGQALAIELPPEPLVIDGDTVRLSQVLSNLLINASKYSAKCQSISLSARRCADHSVAISVKDQGAGIEPALQAFVFDLFMQAPRTLDRAQGGLGIGLSMVRALVEMHGGTVQVCSQGQGQGSEFIVVLPLSADRLSGQASRSLPAPGARPCRILVIEDNIDANETLNFCLSFEGHTVTSAFNGASGLDCVKGGGYDIVVCDIGLPGMDGYEVLRQIRQLRLAPEPRCIAMTGYDQQSYRAHALRVGFDHYLVKPVAMHLLQDVIAQDFPSLAAMN